MKIVVDMNLSQAWVKYLQTAGFEAVHWLSVGQSNSPDIEIANWARQNSRIVMTRDLDFGLMLALRNDPAPSVVQIRLQQASPEKWAAHVIEAIMKCKDHLIEGAILTIDERRARIRILPFNNSSSTGSSHG